MKTIYPAKVLLAWAEAIGGNKKIREWLTEHGYPELGVFTFALRNKEDAKTWLAKNGFEHLAATIAGAEGNKSAVDWLEKYKFDILAKVALSGDGSKEAFMWLLANGHKEMALVAKRIQLVKEQIEEDNNDVHKISSD